MMLTIHPLGYIFLEVFLYELFFFFFTEMMLFILADF